MGPEKGGVMGIADKVTGWLKLQSREYVESVWKGEDEMAEEQRKLEDIARDMVGTGEYLVGTGEIVTEEELEELEELDKKLKEMWDVWMERERLAEKKMWKEAHLEYEERMGGWVLRGWGGWNDGDPTSSPAHAPSYTADCAKWFETFKEMNDWLKQEGLTAVPREGDV
jgi:hypothetical protein